MKYVVSAMSIVNDLKYADGRMISRALGGGLFMLGGVLSVGSEVGFVTAAGKDFLTYHGGYFEANGLKTDGVHYTLPHTHYTTVTYTPDGGWTEVSIYGHEYEVETAQATMVHGDWVAELCGDDTKAVYTESGAEEIFWDPSEVSAVKRKAPRAQIMWEVPHYNTFNPEQKPLIFPALEEVDLFSVNLREARTLFACETVPEVIKAIQKTGKPCFLRMGIKGSGVVYPDRDPVFVPSTGLERTVDPTGCGNTSTAASMVGFAEMEEPAMIAALANVAADYNAQQLGPYPVMDDAMRARIRREAEILAERAIILKTGTEI